MGTLRRFFLVFISALLILSISLGVWSIILHQFIEPEIYFEAFEKGNVYDFVDSSIANVPGATFIDMSQGSRAFVNGIVINFFDYVKGKSQEPNLTLTIDTSALRNFFLNSLDGVRECYVGENPFDENKIPVCIPTNKTKDAFLDELLERRNASSLFDRTELNILDIYDSDRNIEKLRNYVSYYYYALISFFAIALICIILMFILQEEKAKGFAWIGYDFMMSGFGLLASLIGLDKGRALISNLSNSAFDFTPIMDSLLDEFRRRIIISGIVLIVIGVISVIIYFIKKKKDEN